MELNLDWRAERSERYPEVSYEVRPLRVWAFQELMAFWEGRAGEAGEGTPPVSPAESLRLMEIARRIFPDHVRRLEGLSLRRNGAVQAATLEDLCEESALLELAGEVLSRLVAISELGEGDEKN